MAPRGPVVSPVAFVVVVLVVSLAVSPATAVTTGVNDEPHGDRCFPSDGTEFVVGTEGPQIRFVLHLSLLPAVIDSEDPTNGSTTNTSLANGTTRAVGALGIEAVATTETDEIVSLQTGVLFEGIDDATTFLANPFSPFAFVFDYRLTIPAFEGTIADPDYETSDVPVEGPVEEAACSR